MNETRFSEIIVGINTRLDRKILRMKSWALILGIITVALYIWITA